MPLIVSMMFNISKGTDRVDNKIVVLADIDNVSKWMHRDISLAQKALDPATLNSLIDCATGTQTTMRAEWIDGTTWGTSSPQHFVEYYIEPGTNILKRNYDGNVMIAGRQVASASFCEDVEGLIHVDLSSTVNGVTGDFKSLFFYLSPRSEGSIQ